MMTDSWMSRPTLRGTAPLSARRNPLPSAVYARAPIGTPRAPDWMTFSWPGERAMLSGNDIDDLLLLLSPAAHVRRPFAFRLRGRFWRGWESRLGHGDRHRGGSYGTLWGERHKAALHVILHAVRVGRQVGHRLSVRLVVRGLLGPPRDAYSEPLSVEGFRESLLFCDCCHTVPTSTLRFVLLLRFLVTPIPLLFRFARRFRHGFDYGQDIRYLCRSGHDRYFNYGWESGLSHGFDRRRCLHRLEYRDRRLCLLWREWHEPFPHVLPHVVGVSRQVRHGLAVSVVIRGLVRPVRDADVVALFGQFFRECRFFRNAAHRCPL